MNCVQIMFVLSFNFAFDFQLCSFWIVNLFKAFSFKVLILLWFLNYVPSVSWIMFVLSFNFALDFRIMFVLNYDLYSNHVRFEL